MRSACAPYTPSALATRCTCVVNWLASTKFGQKLDTQRRTGLIFHFLCADRASRMCDWTFNDGRNPTVYVLTTRAARADFAEISLVRSLIFLYDHRTISHFWLLQLPCISLYQRYVGGISSKQLIKLGRNHNKIQRVIYFSMEIISSPHLHIIQLPQ